MPNSRVIWKNDRKKAVVIARRLLQSQRPRINWRLLLLPSFLLACFRYGKNIYVTRKNLLFTKKLAFGAATKISQGEDRWLVKGTVESKTQNLLDKERKGFYTEKIRRKQLAEIEMLLEHYLKLLSSDKSNYDEMIKTAYPSRGRFLSFYSSLRKAELEVIHAATSTMRKGSKKERRQWFEKVEQFSKQAWTKEIERIFPQG
jgi:hypothetical protein